MEYDFVLKFMLAEGGADADALVERLGESGCEDAVVGIGQSGRIALNFTREAASASQAVISALEDVKRAIPDARLIEASPDLAGLTDIAEFIGVTRQNVRKLMLSHFRSFPAPVHEGTTALWHLAPVLEWLSGRGEYAIERGLLEVSRIAMRINLAKESSRIDEPVEDRVRVLVA